MSAERLALLVHELRSPVAALAALAERAAGGDLPTPVVQRMLSLALAAGRDVERLLSDPDIHSLRPETVDARDMLAPFAGPRVAVSSEPSDLECDPTRLRQALRNLVENGLRHGSAVMMDGRRDGERFVIDVSDDGPGVAPGIDPFQLGVSGAGSTGYGLWLARGIAEAHGGRLELRADDSARGATFRLSLPLASRASG
jgi:signal transduction histidine kinase